MDTDGWVSANGNCSLELSDDRLAAYAIELIRSLGIKASMGEPKPGTYRDEDGVLVECKLRHRIGFTTTLPVFSLHRKAERLPQSVRPTTKRLYVTDIHVESPSRMRCLRLAEEDHAYLTEGFVPTHNSASLGFLIYSALLRDWEVYIADPSKGGTDFFLAEDYIAGMTGHVYEAAGMMRYVYGEVTRRKALNTEYKVSKVSDLPEEVRPKRVLMILDEFTSLMMQEKPPERSDDPEADAGREEVVRLNNEKQTIGFLAGKIGREARSAEVTLVLATQKLSSKMLDKIPGSEDLRTNLARGLLGNAALGDRQAALRSPYDAPDLGETIPPGRGLWEPLKSPRAHAIQSWYDPGEQDAYREQLGQRLRPWPVEDRPDWQEHVREISDAPTVHKIEDDDAAPVEQDLGEMDFNFDFDEEKDHHAA